MANKKSINKAEIFSKMISKLSVELSVATSDGDESMASVRSRSLETASASSSILFFFWGGGGIGVKKNNQNDSVSLIEFHHDATSDRAMVW